jgi:uncharacterized repeat protein (TIGR01451 family)
VVALSAIAAVAASAVAADTTRVAFGSALAGRFYSNPHDLGPFTATAATSPAFTSSFPVMAFNPGSGLVSCTNATGVNPTTHPFTDVIPRLDGSCAVQAAAGSGLQAGVGSLASFQAAFTGTLAASGPGDVTLSLSSDDGFILGLGSGPGGQPTRNSGPLVNTPATTPLQGLNVVGALNRDNALSTSTVSVHVPGAGAYPLEVDYTECCGGPASLVLRANGAVVQPGADLSVTQSAPATVRGGTDATYNVTVLNRGPGDATGVTLTDSPAADAGPATLTPSQGTCTGTTCALGTLASGQQATVAVRAEAPCRSGSLANGASASADQVDPNPSDNSSTGSAGISTPCAGASGQVSNGGTVTTDPTGAGPDATSGVVLTTSVAVPTGITGVVSIDQTGLPPAGGACPQAANLVSTTDSPTASVSNPLRLRFTFDACTLPPQRGVPSDSRRLPDMTVAFDGVNFQTVPDCKGGDVGRHADPCLESKVLLSNGDALYTVLWSGTSDPGWKV